MHTLMALQQAVACDYDTDVRFAVLLHDLGKGTTPQLNGRAISPTNSAA